MNLRNRSYLNESENKGSIESKIELARKTYNVFLSRVKGIEKEISDAMREYFDVSQDVKTLGLPVFYVRVGVNEQLNGYIQIEMVGSKASRLYPDSVSKEKVLDWLRPRIPSVIKWDITQSPGETKFLGLFSIVK
jgi:uncharacterized protein (UPF0335 family)